MIRNRSEKCTSSLTRSEDMTDDSNEHVSIQGTHSRDAVNRCCKRRSNLFESFDIDKDRFVKISCHYHERIP